MQITLPYSPLTGEIPGCPVVERWLSQLKDSFFDAQAYEAALAEGDRLVYRVSSVEPASGPGDLNYALGVIYPGQVGGEYYLTRGHVHAWREAAEVYLCLSGEGLMLLESEQGECQAAAMHANSVVYVPGSTAHRTINTGSQPLVYWGIYPAAAGHDYAFVQQRGFQQVVVEINGQPAVMKRSEVQKP
jgi:glucose-6-phosphate isomerase, archaeal